MTPVAPQHFSRSCVTSSPTTTNGIEYLWNFDQLENDGVDDLPLLDDTDSLVDALNRAERVLNIGVSTTDPPPELERHRFSRKIFVARSSADQDRFMSLIRAKLRHLNRKADSRPVEDGGLGAEGAAAVDEHNFKEQQKAFSLMEKAANGKHVQHFKLGPTKAMLATCLPEGSPLLTSNGPKGRRINGEDQVEPHYPHQIIFLGCSLAQVRTIKGGIRSLFTPRSNASNAEQSPAQERQYGRNGAPAHAARSVNMTRVHYRSAAYHRPTVDRLTAATPAI